MKEFIKQNWFKLVVLLVVVFIVGGGFYWYQWRPTQIRKKCYNIPVSIGGVNFDKNYKSCLLDKGLEK